MINGKLILKLVCIDSIQIKSESGQSVTKTGTFDFLTFIDQISRAKTPEQSPSTIEEDDSDIPENNRILSEHDWHLLLSGCKKENYAKGQTILTQGIHNSCIYRIHKGNRPWALPLM